MTHSAQPTGKEKWVLTSTDFRPIRPETWVRPDSARRTDTLLISSLNELGLSDERIIGERLMFQEKDYRLLVVDYYTTELDQQYLDHVYRLERSADSLKEKPKDPAMIECFTLEGKVLHLLAKDPYLPAELQRGKNRKRL